VRKRRAVADINVVPYIDVMLVLLIIFMVTAPMLMQGVKVDLPDAAAEPVDNQDSEPLRDQGVAYGSVVTLMAALQEAGAPSVGLVTEEPSAP